MKTVYYLTYKFSTVLSTIVRNNLLANFKLEENKSKEHKEKNDSMKIEERRRRTTTTTKV